MPVVGEVWTEKDHMIKRIVGIALFTALALSATTLPNITFLGTGPGDLPNNGTPDTWTGPYSLSDNGVNILATCFLYSDDMSVGETWTATLESVVGLPNETQLLEAEWLNQQFAVSPASTVAIQQAIWDIFQPNTFPEATWLSRADMEYGTVDPASFDILVAIGLGSTGSVPQNFLVPLAVTTTPEPSLCLVVGAILVFFGLIGKKKRPQ
jgi:hypothetical protein